ncbi:uncharacterized protein LOC122320636 [Drosophila ficusphila]|uniref:uncharacterized protein LOC122320636 n=1 Tax=Drosophila ficusphila TaxID=30025 RepID=UPI001C8A3F41|nr:uncharacterized protein LOC122320636 [Drosophila ficusphila]
MDHIKFLHNTDCQIRFRLNSVWLRMCRSLLGHGSTTDRRFQDFTTAASRILTLMVRPRSKQLVLVPASGFIIFRLYLKLLGNDATHCQPCTWTTTIPHKDNRFR